MKTFETAGVSRKDGKLAVRASNREGDTYQVILRKDGHTDVHLVKLPHAMSKDEIRKHLTKLKYFNSNPEIMALLKGEGDDEADSTKAKKAVAKPTQAKAPAAAKKKVASAPRIRKKKSDKSKEDVAAAPEANDGSEIANTERHDDDGVDIAQELGTPAFAKHMASD